MINSVRQSPRQATSYPYRVFLSYAHEDEALVNQIVGILTTMQLDPLWDDDIHPGTPFTDAIKDMIARSHIFMPIITEHSQHRPWVHQETGYAKALNIPILPIAINTVPQEMIAQLQAISIQPDLANFEAQLQRVNLDRLVNHSPHGPGSLVEVVEWPEKRAELITRYANWVLDCNAFGRVRCQSVFSSFSIPDKDIDDSRWNDFDSPNTRSRYRRFLMREERQILEQHARVCGCSLIIDPWHIQLRNDHDKVRPRAYLARLLELKEFFEQARSSTIDIKIVFSPRAIGTNLIIIGDYFTAESQIPTSSGYRQTIFNSHPPTVLQQINRFDQLFDELYSKPDCRTSLDEAIANLGEWIAIKSKECEALKQQEQCGSEQSLTSPQ